MNNTSKLVLHGAVGDPIPEFQLAAFSDASHADDLDDSVSTSGGFVAIVGPSTFFPICASCKKQTAVAHSSTESEFIALESLLRCEVVPMMSIWNAVLDMS